MGIDANDRIDSTEFHKSGEAVGLAIPTGSYPRVGWSREASLAVFRSFDVHDSGAVDRTQLLNYILDLTKTLDDLVAAAVCVHVAAAVCVHVAAAVCVHVAVAVCVAAAVCVAGCV